MAPRTQLCIGSEVLLDGLVSKPRLNGRVGQVVRVLKDGRYGIRLREKDGNCVSKPISVKGSNLVPVAVPSTMTASASKGQIGPPGDARNLCDSRTRWPQSSLGPAETGDLVFRLVVPFIATGYLGELAAVNHKWRKMARESFHGRLKNAGEWTKRNLVDETRINAITYREPARNIPKCFRKQNLWCRFRNPYKYLWAVENNPADQYSSFESWSLTTVSDANREMMARQYGILLGPTKRNRLTRAAQSPSDRLFAPRGLVAKEEETRIQQCTLLGDGSLWLIALRKVSDNKEERRNDFKLWASADDDSFASAELWAVLYKLETPGSRQYPCAEFFKRSVAAATSPNSGQKPFYPQYHRALLAQKLIHDPLDSSLRFDLHDINYGLTSWSGNGKVMAVVTIIDGFRDHLQVTVFDVMNDDIVQRCQIDVETCKCRAVGSDLDISLNTGGDILSILNCEEYADEGSWTVYDISERNDYKVLFSVDGCRKYLGCIGNDAHDNMNFAFFTPDNDFCLGLSDGSRASRKIETLDFPRFANRVVFFQYNGYHSDLESDEE